MFLLLLLSFVSAFDTGSLKKEIESVSIWGQDGKLNPNFFQEMKAITERRRLDPATLTATAIDIVKQSMDAINGVVSGIEQEAAVAREEINQWANEIGTISEQDMSKYVNEIAEATVMLINADVEASVIFEEMLDLTDLNIMLLEEDYGSGELAFEQIKSGMAIFEVALEGAIMRLQELRVRVEATQVKFHNIAAMSDNMAAAIEQAEGSKDGWLEGEIKVMRAKVYGGCAAALVLYPICLAIGAPLVEGRIKELKARMKNAKAAMKNLILRFERLADEADHLKALSDATFDDLTQTEGKLKTTYSLVQRSNDMQSMFFWKRVILPKLKSLKTWLIAKIEERAERIRAAAERVENPPQSTPIEHQEPVEPSADEWQQAAKQAEARRLAIAPQ